MKKTLNDESSMLQVEYNTVQKDAHDLCERVQGLGRSEKISTSIKFLLRKHAEVLSMFKDEK